MIPRCLFLLAALAAIPAASAQTYFKLVRTELTRHILNKGPITTKDAGGKKAIELVTEEPTWMSRANIDVSIPDRVASDAEIFTVRTRIECTWSLKETVANINVGLNVMGSPKQVGKGDPGPWPTAGSHTLDAEVKFETNFNTGFGVRKWSENGKNYRSLSLSGHCGVGQGLSGFNAIYVYEETVDLLKAGDVEVLEVSGEVDVSPAGDDSKVAALKKGAKVNKFDRIITGLGSKLRLRFPDGTVVDVGELTDMKVNCFVDASDSVQTMLWLRGGELSLRHQSKERPSDLQVKTPTSTTGPRGTEFTIKHNKLSGITTVRVKEGRVEITPIDPSIKPLILGAGQSADVSIERIKSPGGDR